MNVPLNVHLNVPSECPRKLTQAFAIDIYSTEGTFDTNVLVANNIFMSVVSAYLLRMCIGAIKHVSLFKYLRFKGVQVKINNISL